MFQNVKSPAWNARDGPSGILMERNDVPGAIPDEGKNVVPAWLSDFKARYPDTDLTYTNPAQLQEFASWVKSTDPALAEAVTIVDGETNVCSGNKKRRPKSPF